MVIRLRKQLAAIRAIVAAQARDEGLWAIAQTSLHGAIEGKRLVWRHRAGGAR